MDLIKIGKYIAGKRKSLGMTQKQLAEKLGMSDKSVSKWERGVCLPDVSVYKELCSILGISLNEFLAGEDIAQENMIQKSETNIIEVIRDNIDKQKCLKVMKCILLVISICAVSVIGFTIYRLKKPQNYISPVAKDSIEMQTAELLAGPDGAFVYKFITTDEYKKLRLHIYRYESGKLSDQDKVEMGFEDIGSPKSGEIVRSEDMRSSGFQDVDVSITTRELARMIKQAGIDFRKLHDEEADSPLGEYSGAATIFGATGGVMTAALRTAYFYITGEELGNLDFKEIDGLEGIKACEVDIKGTKVRIAVAHGIGNVEQVLDKVRS